jgi:signal transduction histidine kinase
MGPGSAPDLTLEGLVHDLNNVFETISEAADLLEKDPNWTSLAATIHRSVGRGRRIVDSLLTDAFASQDFDAILDSTTQFTCDFLAAMRRPRLQFSREVESGIRIRGTAADWERVLFNLFVNAAQAMRSGGTVEVVARRGEDAIEITVSDDGPGIPPEILPHIFKPRFSTKSSRGLGLNIVESIVRQNGGSVSAANRGSAPGAIFCIRLPSL